MSEADNPQESNNSQFLPEQTVSVDIRVDASELENKLLNQQLDLEDAAQLVNSPGNLEVATDISPGVMDEDTLPSTTAAETDDAVIAVAEETNWLVLVQKLRHRNQNLLNQVMQLEQALSECQEELQSQKTKSQAKDTIIAKASQEITTFQEQTTRLFRELESSHQVAQRQQILIETLTEQLESSQERMAQMERECALTQQRYNQQAHLLSQTENTVRELRDRLHRQQRHTLQFKAALEKCLEVPAINYETNTESVNSVVSFWQEEHLNSILATPGVLPKAQPIQPWSAKPELLVDNSSFWQPQAIEDVGKDEESKAHSLHVRPFQPLPEHHHPDNQSLVIAPWSTHNARQQTTSSFHFPSKVKHTSSHQTDEIGGEDDQDNSTIVSLDTQEDVLPEISWLSQNLNQQEADLASVGEWDSQVDQHEGCDENLPPPDDALPQGTETAAVVQEGDWLANDTNPQELSKSNWPSPIVYPQRPSKGLKSLAAVELPTFLRKHE